MPWPSLLPGSRPPRRRSAGRASQCADRCHRQQAARHLVLALRAAFEARVAVGDAPGQRLVVAGLEVQAGHVLDGAPVAALGGAAVPGRWRSASGDRAAVALGRRTSASAPPSSRAMRAEEVARQVGRGVVRAVGQGVAAVEEVPVGRVDRGALGMHVKVMPGVGDAAALLLDLLALVALQAGQRSRRSRRSAAASSCVQWNCTPWRSIQPARAQAARRRRRPGTAGGPTTACRLRAPARIACSSAVAPASSRASRREPGTGVNGTAPSSFG